MDLQPLKGFFLERLWKLDAEALPWWKALPLAALRILVVVARDIADGQLNLRAMSLVYTTLLSLVPLLAVSFSVLKAFGVHNQIEPFLEQFLEPLGPKGTEITTQVIQFVENIRVGVLGALGLALLFYTVVSLIQKIERAFNFTWRVKQERPVAQRVSGYLTVILVGPVLVFTALGVTGTVMSTAFIQQVAAIEPFGTVIELATRLVPYLLIIAAFLFIYIFIPNTRVSVGSGAHPMSPTTIREPPLTACARRINSTCSMVPSIATTGSWSARKRCTCRTTPTSCTATRSRWPTS